MALSASGLGGQSLTDRVNAARYAISGQALTRVVCKATTEEILGPKKKHLDYLLQCTHEPNVSIPSLANTLIERSTNNSWVVVFKSLITVHHLMCYGNERFTQYLATSNCTFNLGSFMDKSTSGGIEMSAFIRRYAKYLNAKAIAYRNVGADFAKMKRNTPAAGSTGGSSSIDTSLRSISGEKLLKTLPILQSLVDSLLEFDASPRDLSNGVITAAFMLLYRDLIRLFICFNDGITNLLEKFFFFKGKKECREALELYKKFLIRMDRVTEFLKTAGEMGINKGEVPDLTRAPSSLLEALEAHCLQLEGKDPSSVATSKKSSAGEMSKEEAYKKALEEEAEFLKQIEAKKKQSSNNTSLLVSTPGSSSTSSSNKSPSIASPASKSSSASANLLGASFSGNNNSNTGASANDPDFNPFLLGDPIEESTGSTGAKNKKVAEEILALFESNTASMNAGFASSPYFMQPFTHPNISSNPFVPSGPNVVAVSAAAAPSPFQPRVPVMQNVFLPNSMVGPSAAIGQGGLFGSNPLMPGLGSAPTINVNNNSNSNSSSSFEANFASAFPSTTSATGASNSSNSLFSSQPASAANPNDFSLI